MIIEHELVQIGDGRHFEIRRGCDDAEEVVIRLDGVSRKLAHRVREALDETVAAVLEAKADLKPVRAVVDHEPEQPPPSGRLIHPEACWLCGGSIETFEELRFDGAHPVHAPCFVWPPPNRRSLLARILRRSR